MHRTAPLFIAATLASLTACIPAAVTPMPTRVRSPASDASGVPALVFMPGLGDSMTVFEANGMLDSMRAAGLDAEFVACNAHYGYYAKRNLFERVWWDAVKPAADRGHSKVWFVGNSMGGVGSILYAWKHPGQVEGLVLLGPFISRPRVIREIEAAGGLASWSPASVDSADWERQVWLWLRRCAVGGDSTCPRIYLGYGRGDRLAPEHELLARLLPPERVVALEGGHDWPIWRQAWGELLRRGALK